MPIPDFFQIITSAAEFDSIRSFLEAKNIAMFSAEIIWNPQNRVEINDFKKAEQIIKLIEMLDDDEDIKSVHSNLEISDIVMAKLG